MCLWVWAKGSLPSCCFHVSEEEEKTDYSGGREETGKRDPVHKETQGWFQLSRQCNWSSAKCQKCFLEKREASPLSEPHCCLQVTEHRACTSGLKPQAWHHRACSLVTKGSCGWGRGQERRGLGHSPSPAIQPHSSTPPPSRAFWSLVSFLFIPPGDQIFPGS